MSDVTDSPKPAVPYDCPMCDDTGYKDYAGFSMDPCDHVVREPTTFVREERYIVVKRKHLSEAQETSLLAHMARLGLPTVEGVVVESDWPEYETVWAMIDARCTGDTK